MTNLQLFLTIFIPSMTVVAAWYNSNRRFAQMDARFDRMDARFDSIDAELRFFHGETGRLTGRMDEISKRIN